MTCEIKDTRRFDLDHGEVSPLGASMSCRSDLDVANSEVRFPSAL